MGDNPALKVVAIRVPRAQVAAKDPCASDLTL